MGLWSTVLLFLLGLALIVKGGDWFLDGAVWIAETTGVPRFIIGATVVSLATTLPELTVSITGVLEGQTELAVGNAVGSATANLGLILGLSAVCAPAAVDRRQFGVKAGLMAAAAGLLAVAGLLGMKPDNLDIPRSFELAKEHGLAFDFGVIQLRDAHPNTAVLNLEDGGGRRLKMQASSVGGGRIRVDKLDDVDVGFTGAFNTLIVNSLDVSGELAEVSRELSGAKINIANMSLCRSRRGGAVLMVIETDQRIPPVVRSLITELPGVARTTYYEKEAE